jgi:hypothetical protein
MRDGEHRTISSTTSLFSRKGPSNFILTLYNNTRDRPTIDSQEFLDRDMVEESCEGKLKPISQRHHYHPRLVHGWSKTGGSRGTTAGGSRGTTVWPCTQCGF